MTEAERIEKEQPPHETLRGLVETLERETIPMPGHQDPNALKDCWMFAYELIEEMLNECSHLAANTCPYSYGDEHGHQRCSENERLQQQLKQKKAEKLLFDRIKETEINVLKEELESAQELIGDIQASWEQFGALTSELEERINKIKNV